MMREGRYGKVDAGLWKAFSNLDRQKLGGVWRIA
jgi:hypothetical protein